ncbi:Hint domain-containing protein [Thermodesulfobacteriota bacterium]
MQNRQIIVGMALSLLMLFCSGCQTTGDLSEDLPDTLEYKVGSNEAGWEVKLIEWQDEKWNWHRHYQLCDPVTAGCYFAERNGDTVTMKEYEVKRWKRDRMALPEEKRFKALPNKPEVETDEEIDWDASCFGPDTKVLMADGGLREISSIKDGEMVRSYNIEKDEVEEKTVTKTYIFPTKGYYLINGELKATAKHKFLMAGPENTWKKASELRPGDKVQSVNGQITINTIGKINEKDTAHNFEVAGTKAYIVKGGENFYVVHNGL